MRLRKRIFAALLSAAVTVSSLTVSGHTAKVASASNSTFENLNQSQITAAMGAGWNLGNQLEAAVGGTPSEINWGNPVINENLIKAVKKAGFSSIRIPVSYLSKIGSAPNYTIDSSWLNRVQEVVDMCIDNDLYAIINIHGDGYTTIDGGWLLCAGYDQTTIKAKYKACWQQIATRFKGYDEHLIFESMNEEFDGTYGNPGATAYANINAYNQIFVDTVRQTGGNNAKRWLLLPGWNTNIDYTAGNYGFVLPTDNYRSSEIPSGEKRIMISVHYYDPWDFCGQEDGNKTQWGSVANNSSKVPSWGDESYMRSQFKKMYDKFVAQGYPVVIGEYGSIDKSNYDSNNAKCREEFARKVCYYSDMYGLIPVYWDNGYNGQYGFGLFNRSTYQVTQQRIINAIMEIYGGSSQGTVPTLAPTLAPSASDVVFAGGNTNVSYEASNFDWFVRGADTDKVTVVYTCDNANNAGWGVLGWGAVVDGEWKDGTVYSAGNPASTEMTQTYTIGEIKASLGIRAGSEVTGLKLSAYNDGRIVEIYKESSMPQATVTVAPTVKPTIAPTVAPTVMPTRTPVATNTPVPTDDVSVPEKDVIEAKLHLFETVSWQTITSQESVEITEDGGEYTLFLTVTDSQLQNIGSLYIKDIHTGEGEASIFDNAKIKVDTVLVNGKVYSLKNSTYSYDADLEEGAADGLSGNVFDFPLINVWSNTQINDVIVDTANYKASFNGVSYVANNTIIVNFSVYDVNESGDVPEIKPTAEPTVKPTVEPTVKPTVEPTVKPTVEPTVKPTVEPTMKPTVEPTVKPTAEPTVKPTVEPTVKPTVEPTVKPTVEPTVKPTVEPTMKPTVEPTVKPTVEPTVKPTVEPTVKPTVEPTVKPTVEPTMKPTVEPTVKPTTEPTTEPTEKPTAKPTVEPSADVSPTQSPDQSQSPSQTQNPGGDNQQVSTSPAISDGKQYVEDDKVIYATQKYQFVVTKIAGLSVLAYQSSDETIATVNKNGEVTAKKAGSIVITAVCSDGTVIFQQVTVKKPKVELKKKKISLKKGKKAKIKIKKKLSSDKVKKYIVKNKAIVKVTKKGKIIAKKKGKTEVAVVMKSGVRKKCKIVVR